MPVTKVNNVSRSQTPFEEDSLISPHNMDDYTSVDYRMTGRPVSKESSKEDDRMDILRKSSTCSMVQSH